jgi:HPt (histidine-containing phosphotransfer) domain-containing protein
MSGVVYQIDKSQKTAEANYLDELRSELGEDDFCAIIETLQWDAEKQLLLLERLLQTGDLDGAQRVTHRLAGLLAQFGAKTAADLAREMSVTETLEQHRQVIDRLLDLSRAALCAICSKQATCGDQRKIA